MVSVNYLDGLIEGMVTVLKDFSLDINDLKDEKDSFVEDQILQYLEDKGYTREDYKDLLANYGYYNE